MHPLFKAFLLPRRASLFESRCASLFKSCCAPRLVPLSNSACMCLPH